MGRYDENAGLFSIPEFNNRGSIKLAPDALMVINGGLGGITLKTITGANNTVDFQEGISSISIQNNIDPPGSSTASIEVTTPIYSEKSKFWVKFKKENGSDIKVPYFVPMMEVQVFFKGRFLVKDTPQYYPAFWGFIVNVEESYSGGLYKISLQCADMLHWWSYILVAFRPSAQSNIFVGGGQGLTFYGSRFITMNAYEIVYALTTQMGMQNFFTPEWVGKLPGQSAVSISQRSYQEVFKNIMSYWQTRFSALTSANYLKMYGATGNLIHDPHRPQAQATADAQHPKAKGINKSQQASQSQLEASFNVDNGFVENFQVFGEWASMTKSLTDAEYQTKLDIGTEVKTRVEYELYQDVNGTVIFKPPWYNLDVRNLLPYRIKPNDIINFSTAINSDEIVTALEVQVSPVQQNRENSFINSVGYHIDVDLNKQYGHRQRRTTCWWLSGSGAKLAQSYAVGHMGLMNAKVTTSSVTIPGRPEIRLGYPVYIDHKDCFYYVKSINHSFDYGGSFSTTLSLEGQRHRVFDFDPTTGQMAVQQYKVYQLTGKVIKKPTDPVNSTKTTQEQNTQSQGDPATDLEKIYRDSGYMASHEPGIYSIVNQTSPTQSSIREDTVPYTDEFGYRVVGSFRYGRGIVPIPGTVIDGVTIKAASEKSQDYLKAEISSALMTQSSSEDEGSLMGQFFSTEQNNQIETSVPNYFRFPGQPGGAAISSDLATNVQVTGGVNTDEGTTVPTRPGTQIPLRVDQARQIISTSDVG